MKINLFERRYLGMVKALVLYHSQYHGNTAKMAEAVAEGLRNEGCEVTLHNTNEKRFPIETYPQYDCVAIGSPNYYSYMAGMIKTFLDDWYISRNKPGYQGKTYVAFLSHGGGDRAKESFSLFTRLGSQVGETVISYDAPSEEILKKCVKLGSDLAKAASKTR
jgi:NAD(P)H dehydrogenase (quinone)